MAAMDSLSIILRPNQQPHTTQTQVHHAAVSSIVLWPYSRDEESELNSLQSPAPQLPSRRRPQSAVRSNDSLPDYTNNARHPSSNSGVRLLTAGRDATIRCWSSKSAGAHEPTETCFSDDNTTLQLTGIPLPITHAPKSSHSNSLSSPPHTPSPSSGRFHRHFEGHTEWITSGALLANNSTLVTASLDTTIKLWDLRASPTDSRSFRGDAPSTGPACITTLCKHRDYIQSVSYCRWNQMLISAGLGFELYSWRVDAPGAPELIENLSGGGTTIPTDQTPTGQVEYGVHEFDQLQGSFYATSLSENGDTLLTGGSDQIVRLYDTRSVSTSIRPSSSTNTPNRNWLKLLGHTDTVRSVHLSEKVGSGLSMAYSASADGSIKEWDLRMQRCVSSVEPAASSNRPKLARLNKDTTGNNGNTIGHRASRRNVYIPSDRFCDLREKMFLQSKQLNRFDSMSLQSALSSLNSSPATTRTDNALWCMTVNDDCSRVYSAGAGSTVWMTNFATGESEPLVRFRSNPTNPHTSSVTALTLDQANDTLWVAGWDSSVSGWNIKENQIKTKHMQTNALPPRHISSTLVNNSSTISHPASATSTPVATSMNARHLMVQQQSAPHLLMHNSSAPSSVGNSAAASDEEDEEGEPDDGDAGDGNGSGVFPHLRSCARYILPMSPLPPIEKFVALHDRVHVLAMHSNNSRAFELESMWNQTGGNLQQLRAMSDCSAFPLLVSTWNLVECCLVDVAKIPFDCTAGIDASAVLDQIAATLNSEFLTRMNALNPSLCRDPKDPSKPLPSHKIFSPWFQLDARFGCLSFNLERKSAFAADSSNWFKERIAALQQSVRTQQQADLNQKKLIPHLTSTISSSARLNLGESCLFSLLAEWIWIEDLIVSRVTPQQQSSSPALADLPTKKDGRLLRPLPPSSQWISSMLFPDTTSHALACGESLMRSWDSNFTPSNGGAASSTISIMVFPPKDSPCLPIVATIPQTYGPTATNLSTPTSLSPPLTSSDVITARAQYATVIPAWVEGIIFAPSANAGPITQVQVAREKENLRPMRETILVESRSESENWQLRSKRGPAATAIAHLASIEPAVHLPTSNTTATALSTNRSIADNPSPVTTARSRPVQKISGSATSSQVDMTDNPNINEIVVSKSEDLPVAIAVEEESQQSSSSNSSLPGPTPRRSSFSVMLASPRYAPQALVPGLNNVPAAARDETTTAAGEHAHALPPTAPTVPTAAAKIHFQLLPFPTTFTNNSNSSGHGHPSPLTSMNSLQRRLMEAADGSAGSDSDDEFDRSFQVAAAEGQSEMENRRDALRMRSSRSNSRAASPVAIALPPLPAVGSGSLVVPSSLPLRRICGYICQQLWKNEEQQQAAGKRSLLPQAMREDFERLRAKLRKDRLDAATAASGNNNPDSSSASSSTESSSPASAAVASGLERKPTLVSVSSLSTPVKASLSGHSALSPPSPTGTPHATPSAHSNALSPSAITFASSPVSTATSTTGESPSMLRRTISFSTTAHMLQSQYGINSTTGASVNTHPSLDGSSSTPSHPSSPISHSVLAQPEHFVQLLLWNPVSRTPHLLSGDMEIGSVREVIWPKVKRQTSAASLAIPTAMDPSSKRSSGSFGNKELLPALETGNSNVNPRLMLVYYTRTPAAEEWLKHELRLTHSETTDQIKRTGGDTERPSPHHPPTDNLQRSTSTSQLASIHPPVSSRSVAPRIMPSVQTATNLRVSKPMPVPAQISVSSSSHVRTIRDPISASGGNVAYIPTSVTTPNGSASSGITPLSPLPVRTFTSTLPVSAPFRPPSATKRTGTLAPVVATSSSSSSSATGSRPSSAVKNSGTTAAATAMSNSAVRPSSASVRQRSDANGKDRMAEDNVGVVLSRHRP